MPEDYSVSLQQPGEPAAHEYLYIGGPIENPKEYAEIFSAFGLASAAWGRMEQHIDAILVQINKQDHSDNLYDEDHPRPFGDKLDLLKSYFNHHPALEPYRDEISDIVPALRKMAIERNEAAHGILEHYDKQERTYTINGMRYRKKTKDFLNRRRENDIELLAVLTDFINQAHYRLCAISKELFTTGALELLRKPPSQTLG